MSRLYSSAIDIASRNVSVTRFDGFTPIRASDCGLGFCDCGLSCPNEVGAINKTTVNRLEIIFAIRFFMSELLPHVLLFCFSICNRGGRHVLDGDSERFEESDLIVARSPAHLAAAAVTKFPPPLPAQYSFFDLPSPFSR